MNAEIELYLFIFIVILIVTVWAVLDFPTFKIVRKKFKRKTKEVVCKHVWIQFGTEEGKPLNKDVPWVFCKHCGRVGLLKDEFLDSLK